MKKSKVIEELEALHKGFLENSKMACDNMSFMSDEDGSYAVGKEIAYDDAADDVLRLIRKVSEEY